MSCPARSTLRPWALESINHCDAWPVRHYTYGYLSSRRDHSPVKLGSVPNRARQLYKNISMLFLFPVKDGKLSTGVNATFDASCYG